MYQADHFYWGADESSDEWDKLVISGVEQPPGRGPIRQGLVPPPLANTLAHMYCHFYPTQDFFDVALVCKDNGMPMIQVKWYPYLTSIFVNLSENVHHWSTVLIFPIKVITSKEYNSLFVFNIPIRPSRPLPSLILYKIMIYQQRGQQWFHPFQGCDMIHAAREEILFTAQIYRKFLHREISPGQRVDQQSKVIFSYWELEYHQKNSCHFQWHTL